MLRAFKEQLKYLAQTNNEELLSEIENRSNSKPNPEVVNAVRSLILVMPDLIGQIQIWAEDDRIPSNEKKLHGFVLTYLYHPMDFIPDSHSQFFSYVDDAYLVGQVFLRAPQHFNFDLKNKGLENLAKDVSSWTDIVREIIPKETKKIDRMLQGLIQGRFEKFDDLMAKT